MAQHLREAYPRCQVAVVRRYAGFSIRRLAGNYNLAGGYIEVRQPIVRLGIGRKYIVAEAQVKRKRFRQAPVILHIDAWLPCPPARRNQFGAAQHLIRHTFQKINHCRAWRRGKSHKLEKRIAVVDFMRQLPADQRPAYLDVMRAPRHG